MDDETMLIIAAALAVGIGIWGVSKPINTAAEGITSGISDVTGIIPWIQGEIDQFENEVLGWAN